MKRWIFYLFVFVGLHVFYFYSTKSSIQNLQERDTPWSYSSKITSPNWSNPIKDDIFIIKDSSAAINYYKIIASSIEDSLTILPGKFTFKSQEGKDIYSDTWNYDFVNSSILYADTVERYSLDEFYALKKNAHSTHGYRYHPPKKVLDLPMFFFIPYLLAIKSIVAFFVIWLFGYLSNYIPIRSSLSRKLIWISFAFIFFIFLVECAEGVSLFVELRLPIYTKFLLTLLILVVGVSYINNRWLHQLRFYDREAAKFLFIVLASFAVSLVATFLQFQLGLFTPSDIEHLSNFSLFNRLTYLMAPLTLPFSIILASGNFFNNFRIQYFKLRKEAKALKIAQNNELKFQAEIESLQAKINPHFLYNSLNSIASLAQEDPSKTEEMAMALSKFYKETTNRKDQHSVTVEEEMSLLKTYLEIEKIRFGDRLEVVIDCDASIKSQEIPRFLLQPLVENAIKYGYNAKENKTFVQVVAKKLEDKLVFKIIDHGTAFPDNLGTGYGLRSVQKKLKLFYPEKHELAFINSPEKQVYIEIMG